MIRYRSAILLAIFLGIFLLFFIFLINLANKVMHADTLNSKIVSVENKAVRGKIISADNFVLAYSNKLFKAEINTRSIDPTKKNLFIKLFSIYSGMSEQEVASKFVNKSGKAKSGYIVIAKNLDYRLASDLKSLSHKMMKLKIFRPLNPKKPHMIHALDIVPFSENRYFPHKNILTPVLGYVRQTGEKYKKSTGIKGLEKAYSAYLLPEQDGKIQGKSDALRTPLLNGESKETKRVDGLDLHLNIPIAFQKEVETILDEMKNQTAAEEVMAAVMDSQTGQLLALATSERFNPSSIHQKDVNILNPNFAEYLYEPGSVMKPFTMAVAIEHNKVNLRKPIPLGGKFVVNKHYTISDDDNFKALTPKGIVMYSSNIGISKIAWRLSGEELYNGWRKFGFARLSGIDLSKELAGRIKPAYLLNYKVHAANTAYGYGLLVNFMQLMKAYSAFNNDGIAVTPKIVHTMSDKNSKHYAPPVTVASLQACSAKTADIVKDMLLGTVNRGTGTAAQYDGLEVGGKTGTAHISEHGRYVEKYHSSFFGFANDEYGHKYSVGVFVIKPKKVYFASQTAAPTFQKIIGKMVEKKYLIVNHAQAKIDLLKREAMRKRKHDAYVRKIKAYNKAHDIESKTKF